MFLSRYKFHLRFKINLLSVDIGTGVLVIFIHFSPRPGLACMQSNLLNLTATICMYILMATYTYSNLLIRQFFTNILCARFAHEYISYSKEI